MFVIIVGGGQIGSYLASLLLKEGHRIKLIETRQELTERLEKEFGDRVTLGSGTNPKLLEGAGIRNADVVAAVTGADETNLVVANLARFEFGVPRVIGRVNNPRNAWLFTSEMGVDVALNQADLMGRMILEEMSLGDMMTLLKLRKGQFSLVEEKVDPDAVVVGIALHDIQFPDHSVLAAVIRKGELIMPRGDTVLQASDEILAIVHASQVKDLARLLGPKS
jgi:trk system potassium uptake protein TrkA